VGVSALGGLLSRSLATGAPLDPDAEEARRLLLDELTGADYRAAQPTWFDLLAAAVRDWLASLTLGAGGGPPGVGTLVVVLIVAAALVVAYLVFGAPRLNRRSTVTGGLFGDDDRRDAAAIRTSAQLAAARGEHALAITEMFRAIARGLAERTVLTTTPGTTAHDFAVRAGRAFPASVAALATAASVFDDVRYLGGEGTSAQYEQVAELERALRAARPVLEPVAGAVHA
jgi:hypothetical protein